MAVTKEEASRGGKMSSRKGIPNKSTTEIREAFQLLVFDKLPKLSKWIDEVAKKNPEKALLIIAKYSEFVLPKVQRTEISENLSVEQLLRLTREERQVRILELSKKLNRTG